MSRRMSSMRPIAGWNWRTSSRPSSRALRARKTSFTASARRVTRRCTRTPGAGFRPRRFSHASIRSLRIFAIGCSTRHTPRDVLRVDCRANGRARSGCRRESQSRWGASTRTTAPWARASPPERWSRSSARRRATARSRRPLIASRTSPASAASSTDRSCRAFSASKPANRLSATSSSGGWKACAAATSRCTPSFLVKRRRWRQGSLASSRSTGTTGTGRYWSTPGSRD